MSSRSTVARAALPLIFLGISTLPGCLTQMLWAESLDGPPLMHAEAVCYVHRVRGDFLSGAEVTDPPTSHTSAVGHVEVEFSVTPDKFTPTEVEQFTADNPGWLMLRPPETEANWLALPGADRFVPWLWEMGVHRASYFENRESSVPLSFVGDLAPEQIGEVRGSAAAPIAWRTMRHRPLGADLDDRLKASLKSFAARNWVHLITGTRPFSERDAVPLAWLDQKGRVLSAKDLHEQLATSHLDPTRAADLAKYTLLGRLEGTWGDPLYVRVPLPVLIQGEALRLKRAGKRVLWQRSQVWRGEFRHAPSTAAGPYGPATTDDVVATAVHARPANSIPLVSQSFRFTYAEEDTSESLLVTLAKYVLTPPAVLLDFAARTSVFYLDIIRWMADGQNQKWVGPFAGDRKK